MEEGSEGFSRMHSRAATQETDRDRNPKARHFDQRCQVQKPFLKDLDAYRKPLKLSRSAALVKLATEHLAGLKEPVEKLWEGAVGRMFPATSE